ncbi:MAG: heparan-alpha-glucosaminide N-acetyltransferase domain-containing protein [Planctomycetota bacterium]|nr:heparan-alpha-glucosaminide N-acetyltransferase domain-containing protein [Planctomycetota bacterium]
MASLDQFRGYTVLGMAFVNFLGGYLCMPQVIGHHHSYFSYADAIMPQFFFAVGFAFRLTLLKTIGRDGYGAAMRKGLVRCLGLLLVAFAVHGVSGGVKTWEELRGFTLPAFLEAAFKRDYFQTLTHIGVTSLWVLPVITRGPGQRLAWAVVSALAHVALSLWFNYQWTLTNPVAIDGGPLGFLTWTLPLLAGSFAYDWCSQPEGQGRPVARLLGWGVLLMLAAYALSCLNLRFAPNDGSRWLLEPPFLPPADPRSLNYWTMSQRAGSVTYLLFAAGFSMAVMGLFVVLCDRLHWRWSVLDTLGGNALVAYIILGMLEDPIRHYVPKDSPAWFALSAWGLQMGLCWLFLRKLEKNGVHIRV